MAGSTNNATLMTVALPVPTPEEVEEFARLYLRLYGVELTEREAWETATRTLRLFCLATYGLPQSGQEKSECQCVRAP